MKCHMPLVNQLHYVDDKVFGYRFGYIFWFSLYAVSLVVLSVDDTTGNQRNYLTNTGLMSCLSLVYYSYHQFIGNPSSVPGQHAAGTEGLARILYAAHCGWSNIVGTNPIGAWNTILLVISGLFAVSKIPENLHSIWNRQLYITYVNEEKEAGIR
jgi:hypothetical protein